MRGFSLRWPVAFYRSRSSPSPTPHSLFVAPFPLSPSSSPPWVASEEVGFLCCSVKVKIGDLVCVWCEWPVRRSPGLQWKPVTAHLPLIFSWLTSLVWNPTRQDSFILYAFAAHLCRRQNKPKCGGNRRNRRNANIAFTYPSDNQTKQIKPENESAESQWLHAHPPWSDE